VLSRRKPGPTDPPAGRGRGGPQLSPGQGLTYRLHGTILFLRDLLRQSDRRGPRAG
jgi:hypothetical protein